MNISPMTPAPRTEPGEAPMAWKNLQNKRKGTVCAEATPAEPMTRIGRAHKYAGLRPSTVREIMLFSHETRCISTNLQKVE